MNENVECSETKMNLRVTLDWRTTLATAVLLPTLLFLGFWQLDRADEKVDLIARMEERRVLPRGSTRRSSIRAMRSTFSSARSSCQKPKNNSVGNNTAVANVVLQSSVTRKFILVSLHSTFSFIPRYPRLSGALLTV